MAALVLVSCNKETTEDNFTDEVSSQTENLLLPESGFEIVESTPLSGLENDRYTEGVLEYTKNGEVLAVIDFAADTDADHALITEGGEERECKLERTDDDDSKKKKWKKHKRKYKKVIVEPIIRTEDCDYIVAGIVKFFEIESGDWVATIDFGDGSCDDLAVKTTADGDYEFTLHEWMK